MRFSEFKMEVKQRWVKPLIDLSDLEQYHPANDRRVILVKDPRSYKTDGKWNIYPIGVSSSQVYIVCPYCGESMYTEIQKANMRGGDARIARGDIREKPNYNILRYVPELKKINVADLMKEGELNA